MKLSSSNCRNNLEYSSKVSPMLNQSAKFIAKINHEGIEYGDLGKRVYHGAFHVHVLTFGVYGWPSKVNGCLAKIS